MAPVNTGVFDPERLKRVTHMLGGYVTRGELAGISALIGLGSQIAYRETFGYRDIRSATPLTGDTIFRIMSMTKPVTAVAAMLLYEEGHFDLNTPIARFLPAYEHMQVLLDGDTGELVPATGPITFRHLFTHTSGLSYGSMPDDALDKRYRDTLDAEPGAAAAETLQSFAAALAALPLAFQPGSQWRYGFSLDVLGALIEVVSGQPLDEFMRTRIFEPLGMIDTGFSVPDKKTYRLASAYRSDPDGGLARFESPIPMRVRMWGGGGLVSTLDDYARFAAMLANGGSLDGTRLLGPTTAAMFSTNWAPAGALPSFHNASPEINGGYGLSLGGAVLTDPAATGKFGNVGEYYWGGAFSTYFWVDPQLALYAVLMTQFSPVWQYPTPWQFKQLTYQALMARGY